MNKVVLTILLCGLLSPAALARRVAVLPQGEVVNRCASAQSMPTNILAWHRDQKYPHEVPIWRFTDDDAFFFVSGMTIDADGAPNAYHPDDTGLDELANAGSPAHWDGIITDRDGNPLIQNESDPFPGHYISCTSLADESKQFTDPTRYVDATTIPYVALPKEIADRGGLRLGDFAFVTNLRNGRSSFAIYADIGTLGEGSVELADALGIPSDARDGGQSESCMSCFRVRGICGLAPLARSRTRAKRSCPAGME